MYDTIPDILRKQSIASLFAANTFNNCWATWRVEINNILGQNYTENEIINLGDQLSHIFRTTGAAGRNQGELSGGGTAWESLVCWYINLCTVGSRIVAIKKMSLVPKPIREAITVNYGNFSCNTESDITVIVFPDTADYNSSAAQLNIQNPNGQAIPTFRKGILNPDVLDYLCGRDFVNFEIGIIQCKTNWNDNAQIPMLWDMIYSAGGFRGRNITIGKNGYSIQAARNFTYSFITVPSNRNANYQSNSVAVKRVTNLSGGNYWGGVTIQNVARSIKEIFTNNYNAGFRNNLRTDIRNAIPFLPTGNPLDYFKI